MRMLLAVPALALLAAPALAKPDVPYKAEIRMHVSEDGRADLHVSPSSRPDAYDRTVNNVTGSNHDRFGRDSKVVLPFKADVQQKLSHSGDNPEGAAHPAAAKPREVVSHDNNPYAGLRASKFAPPIKTQVALRLQGGDNRDSSTAKSGSAAKPADHNDRNARKAPLSRDEKTSLCRHTGVCLPFLAGSDDTEDKTE